MTMLIIFCSLFVFWLFGIRIVRPTQRGLIERLGKYHRFADPGFNWIIPIIDSIKYVLITERMSDVAPQDIITKDNLNATVDLVVYYKVRDDEENVKRSRYNVNNFRTQIVSLAQTTARNVIGDMSFKEVNSQRNSLNKKLMEILDQESDSWGVAIVRVELKEISPPEDVQNTMNKIIKAENERQAATDFAKAQETKADGERMAAVKRAAGIKQSTVLQAEGQAEAIELVNKAADKFFTGNAVELKKIEAIRDALGKNTKFIIPSSQELLEVVNGLMGKKN